MNFNFRAPLGGTPGAPKSKIKIRAHFVVLPKNPQHNNILSIAWTIEQLNLKFKKMDGGTKIHGGAKITQGPRRKRVIASPSDGLCQKLISMSNWLLVNV